MKKQEATSASGEKALIEQIASLQGIPEGIIDIMENTLRGALDLENDADHKPWVEFRENITNNPKLRSFLMDHEFLYGLSVMNKVIDRLLAIYIAGDSDQSDRDFGVSCIISGDEQYLSLAQSIPKIILGAPWASERLKWKVRKSLAGFLKLREAFTLLTPDDFAFEFEVNRYYKVKVLLDLIIWCLKYLSTGSPN